MTTVEYTVDGMTCGHCAHAVTEEISHIPGVSQVDVDVPSGRVSVSASSAPARASIQSAVEEAGYLLRPERGLPLA